MATHTEDGMTKPGISLKFALIVLALLTWSMNAAPLKGQTQPQPQKPEIVSAVPVTMTVGLSVPSGKQMPSVTADDVIVKQGKDRRKVIGWTPATGDHAALDLYILIDDVCDPVLGSHLDDIRTFVNSLPPTASVAVGYMRNATVQVAQDFTTDHDQVAKALRMPTGTVGTFASPYLSVIDLMKRWPRTKARREIVMITDGIDRAHRHFGPMSVTTDEDVAAEIAQRTDTIIHTVYAPGTGRYRRNYWEANNGQITIAKLSDDTGGESFFLGFQNPVTLAPYFDEIATVLGNQYFLRFEAMPGKKDGQQSVEISTPVAGVEISAADAVWVPAAK